MVKDLPANAGLSHLLGANSLDKIFRGRAAGEGAGAGRPGAQGRAAGSPSAPGLCPLTTGAEDYQLNSECNSDVVCPHKCRCEASMVECSSLKLTKIPERVPQATAEL